MRANEPVVRLRGLAKAFRTPRGVVQAVAAVDLELGPGETVALLGPNGAGKSTTLDLLLGLTAPDRGAVEVLGGDPRAATRAGRLGAMLQSGALVRNVSPRELVDLVRSLHRAPLPAAEVLALAGIEAIADRRTEKLSGGEAQRVRLALALASDPELLVLDEPTVGVDVERRRAFWEVVRATAARGTTVLFATHDMAEVDAYADRVVVLLDGRVVADGPVTEVRARVGRRTVRATLSSAWTASVALAQLPGVVAAERRGDSVALSCADADAAVRALLAADPGARDLEIAVAGMEEAFVALTRSDTAGRGISEVAA